MKKVLSMIGAMLLTMSLNAQTTTLKILPFSINPGETKTVTLDLDNPDFIAASFKCDIVLPEGLEIKKNARGKYDLSFNADADRTSLEYHSISSQVQSDGAVRIVCYSSSAEAFMGNSGAILNIPIVASETATTGEVKVTNQEVTDATGTIAVKPADYAADVTVTPTGIGEVNGAEGALKDGKYVKANQIIIVKGNKVFTTVGTSK